MAIENQLDAVRKRLVGMPRSDWARVGVEADLTIRVIYKVMDERSKPGYNTVFRLYSALDKMAKSKRARGGQ